MGVCINFHNFLILYLTRGCKKSIPHTYFIIWVYIKRMKEHKKKKNLQAYGVFFSTQKYALYVKKCYFVFVS